MKRFWKYKEDLRTTILAYIILALMVVGLLIGCKDDWTTYVLLIPFNWIIVGLFFDWAINGNESSKFTMINASLATFMLFNVAVIPFRMHEQQFIIGRIICCAGCMIGIIRTTRDAEKEIEKKYKDENK